MDVQKIIDDIKSNDPEVSGSAMQTVYTHYGQLGREDVERMVPSIVYYLWKLPKFPVQKMFVLELLGKTDETLRTALLRHVIRTWDEIELVRMDKFYYLMRRILEYYPLTIETIPYLFNMTHNIGLRAFVVRCVVSRLAEVDGEIEDFLAEFVSKCPPALLLPLGSVRLRRETALRYAKKRDIGKKNRSALYSMIK